MMNSTSRVVARAAFFVAVLFCACSDAPEEMPTQDSGAALLSRDEAVKPRTASTDPIKTRASRSDVTSQVTKTLELRRTLVRTRIHPLEERVDALARSLDLFAQALYLGDDQKARSFFAEKVETNRRVQERISDDLDPSVAGIWFQGETVHYAKKMSVVSSSEVLLEFTRVLSGFRHVRGTGIKVISADPGANPGQLSGRLKWTIVGRHKSGDRVWLRTTAEFVAEQAQGRRPGWLIHKLRFEATQRMRAKVDLFSEVSAAAGLSVGPPKPPPKGLEEMSQSFPGIAVFDVDGNGFVDVFITNHTKVALYLNEGGKFRVWEPDATMLKSMWSGSTAVPLFLDYDSDGDVDLFMGGTGSMRLFQNQSGADGQLRFVDVSQSAGVMHEAYGYSVAAGDVNKDGHTDIFVPSYNRWPEVIPDNWIHATNGTQNLLLMNQGDGTFREEAQQRGLGAKRWSFAAQMGDLDGDGDLDIYVANDYGSGSTLYVNDGGHFTDQGKERGLLHHGAGMGVSIADYNNDGHLDLHLTNMSSVAGARIFDRLTEQDLPQLTYFRRLMDGNSIFQSKGDGTFQERSAQAGPFLAGWAWGGGFIDIDNNGWEDLYVPNGFISGASIHDT